MTDVRQWLESLGLSQYAEAFEDNAIEWRHLPDLDQGALKELGVRALGHRMTLVKAIGALGEADDGSPASAASAPPERATPTGEAERRQLTVMFCDLVGSTELSTRLDPEELSDVMRAFQDRCAGCITRFGGYIARYMGDGLLVYFGFPQAYEDGPERAVRAGLATVDAIEALSDELRGATASRLSVRIGIATGMVVVGDVVGEGAAAESAVVGETPNLAARLQGLAEPDQVVISAATQALVGGRFKVDDLGCRPLKGLSEPVSAWRVLGEASSDPADSPRYRGQTVPLVGRREELGLLLRAWESSRAGHGQVVLVSGEPGIGKSRLIDGLRERLGEDSYLWVPVHCSPYHAQSALYPVIEQLKRALRWESGDSTEIRLEKLEQAMRGAGFTLEDVVPLYAAFLSLRLPAGRYLPVELEPRQQRQATLDAISAWLFTEAERRPVIQVWEDLHWADPSTLELLALYVEQAPTARMLNVVTFRSEFTPEWPRRSHITPITLNRFERPEAESLIAHLGGGKRFPDEVVAHIVDKADGVALYVEELTKSIRESGLIAERADRFELTGTLGDLRIPATLQDTLMSRLDRLPDIRELAQLGAVIGREFGYEMLEKLAGVDEAALRAGLAKLVDAELLYQRGRPPRARYIFKHALIQDAAYQSLLRRTRQQHHRRVAALLEVEFPEVVEASPDLVAQHFAEAGDAERALDYWQKAGDRALGQSANHEAIAHLTRGLSLLERLSPGDVRDRREIDLQVAFGDAKQTAKGMGTRECRVAYGRALELCRGLNDSKRLYPIQFGLWRFHVIHGEFDASLALASDLARRADSEEATVPGVFADYALGFTYFMKGELTKAAEHLDRALLRYEPTQRASPLFIAGQDPGEACGVYRACLSWLQGFPDRAAAQCTRALAHSEAIAHPISAVHGQSFAAVVHQQRGEPEEVLRLTERNIALTTERGMAQWRGLNQILRGWATQRSGRGEGVIDQMRAGMESWRESGVRALVPYLNSLLAEALMYEGRTDDALAAIEEALGIVEEIGDRFGQAELLRLRGVLTTELDTAASDTALHAALDLAEAQGARGYELRAATSLAQRLQQRGMNDRAREILAPRFGWFSEGFDTADLREARTVLDGL